MILRPVRPVSRGGPRGTKRPVGFTRISAEPSSKNSSGITGRMTASIRSSFICPSAPAPRWALSTPASRPPRAPPAGPHVRLGQVVLCLPLRARPVLGAYQHLLDAHGGVALVAHRHLALAVGPQVVELAHLAHLREAAGEGVGERYWQGHQLGRLLAGVAEHHALVAGPYLVEGRIAAGGLPRPAA